MKLFSTIIVIIGIVQGLFIGSALVFENIYSSRNNKYIGTSLLLFSYQGILDLLAFWKLNEEFLFIEILTYFGVQGLILVPYFLSVLESTKTKLPFPKFTLFIPFILSCIYGIIATIIVVLGIEDSYWDRLWMNEFWAFHWYLNMLFVLIMDIYLFERIRDTSSANETHEPFRLWISFTILIGIWLIINFLNLFFSSEEYYLIILTLSWGSFTLFTFWLTYRGVVQQRLINEQKSLHFILKQTEVKKSKKEIAANNYYEQFIRLLEEEKIYRKADINRDKIAKKIGISSGYFSTMLSQSSSQSFNEIINEYRVKEVMEILKNGSLNHFSLTAIGLEVGYKSKSAFFTNFKKITGLSPNDYKKKFQS